MIPDPHPRPLDHLTLLGAPNANALVYADATLTYAQLERRIGALASWLSTRGLMSGDRVASWLPKTLTACLMPLAAARAGLVHVPINPVLRRMQVAHILTDSGATMLITQAGRAETLDSGDVPEGC
ncbi:MAG: AMP-binding protein, partial [Alphaproteobacteria bacterium]|nr:AMP-binding protein [Alphaproteobacteria bacterium]